MKASGKFDVKLQPLEISIAENWGNKFSGLSIDKTFRGELNATGKGEMLSVSTPVQDSAGYVAVEHVTGSLSGKKGSFVLQHYGIMNRGNSSLLFEVIPDSGTDELKGISGKMSIRIVDKQHYYDFNYEINE